MTQDEKNRRAMEKAKAAALIFVPKNCTRARAMHRWVRLAVALERERCRSLAEWLRMNPPPKTEEEAERVRKLRLDVCVAIGSPKKDD